MQEVYEEGDREGAFCDIQVIHPSTPSYFQTQVDSLFRRLELEKKQEYGDRVCTVECGSFTLLVFSTFGGLGMEATIFYNCLVDILSHKHGTSYNWMLSWMWCVISFLLLHSAMLAIRGSRNLQSTEHPMISTKLYLVESWIE